MSKILTFLSPITRYLGIIGMVVALLFGAWTAHNYYTAKIVATELAYNQRLVRYTEQLINLDRNYMVEITKYKNTLKVTQRKLHEEVLKPDYSCPIPDAGIQLLNRALGATGGRDSIK